MSGTLIQFLYLSASFALIMGLALMLHFMGRSKPLSAESEEAAKTLFKDDLPDEDPRGAALSKDGSMALIELADPQRIGVLRAMGTYWMTRLLASGDIASVTRTRKGALKIALHDYADPIIVIALRDDGETERWLERLDALRRPQPQAQS